MGVKSRKQPIDMNDIPKGMKLFTVVGATIKDSTGSYRDAGELCLLDKTLATRYHRMNMIKVDLPDFDEGDDGRVAGKKPAAGESAKAEADAGEDNGKIKP